MNSPFQRTTLFYPCNNRFFDGESIPDPVVSIPERKKEAVVLREATLEDPSWPKTLPSFQVECVSTVSSEYGLSTGTVLFLEPECKIRVSRKRAQSSNKNSNEALPARCRVYQQVGPNENQRVCHSYDTDGLALHRTHRQQVRE